MEYPNQSSDLAPHLTQTELRVLKLAATGLRSKEIATELDLSKRTVDFHLGNIYKKLDVGNRLQATNKARAFGLLE